MVERKRLHERDCLAEMRRELERQAATVKPWQADEWAAWMRACGELLAAVPDDLQRISWAWSLAQPVTVSIVGIAPDLLIGTLLAKANEYSKAVQS